MRAGRVLIAALLLVFTSLVIQVCSEDIYWEGEEDASNEFLEVKEHDDSSLLGHLSRIKRQWNFFSNLLGSSPSTTPEPENIEDGTADPLIGLPDDDADGDGSGAPGLVDSSEPREKTLRVTFVAMQPYQDEYSNRDSSQFQNFSRSLANAVNKIYEEQARMRKISGTQRASLVRIQSRTSDDFSCKVTLDIVTTGYYKMDKITEILRDHIRLRRSLEGVAVSESDFSANVIDPGSNDATDPCPIDWIRCESGTCLPGSKRCNGVPDCPDGADEAGCLPDNSFNEIPGRGDNDLLPTTTERPSLPVSVTPERRVQEPERTPNPKCHDDELQCDHTRCVSLSKLCDGERDCDDHSDEQNCNSIAETCGADDFRCKNGKCMPKEVRCNNIVECPDSEDEIGCDCQPGEFKCRDSGNCIEDRKRCDTVKHCNDGSDEIDCPGACKSNQWQCDYGNCIKRSQRCDGRVDCPTDRSDERNCLALPPKKSPAYFMCKDGTFIPPSLRCNRQYDCPRGDYSDEVNCPCGDGDFRCDNGYCIPASKHCDKTHDCQDRSDERGCEYGTICMAYQYKCTSGQCVRADAQCNGTVECADGSDERNCPCKRDELQCRDGSCLNIALRCNGQKNCPGGEDELNCDTQQCAPDQFSCLPGSSVRCAAHCNGANECDNGEDEMGCSTQECVDTLDPLKICDGVEDCPDGSDEYLCDNCDGPDDFRCGDGECLRKLQRCNGLPDCPDGSDEAGCNSTMISSRECTATEFQCSNGVCIASQFYCDDTKDCTDGSDEENCRCKDDQKQCRSGQCILEIKFCDGARDCPDNSDEDECSTPGPRFEEEITTTTFRPVYTTTTRVQPEPPRRPPYRPYPQRPDTDDSRGACNRNEWRCENGPCIDASRRCNGRRDCPWDDSDELDCPPNSPAALDLKTYPTAQVVRHGGDVVFQCRDEGPLREPVRWIREGGRPIKAGSIDNAGRLEMSKVTASDSGVYICQAYNYVGAPGSETRVTLSVENPTTNGRPAFSSCQPSEATCINGQCIPKSFVCDGKFDCADKSDEETCHQNGLCEPNEFHCDNRRCVLKSWICDSEDDCGDGSDERNCGVVLPGQPCAPSEFTCSDNQCIPKSFHCDGHPDCMDGVSDENGCMPVAFRRPPNPPYVRLNEGDTLRLECEATGVPIPVINWRLNWGHIPAKCSSTSDNGISVLTCPNMQLDDSGAYSCEAINNRGTAFAIPDSIVTVNQTSMCPQGYFNSEARSPSDCIRCFCFGESTECKSADLFIYNMATPLGEGGTRIIGVQQDYNGGISLSSIDDQYHYQPLRNGATITKLEIYGLPRTDSHPYLTLPESYNGNQLTSYGGYIRYKVSPHSPRYTSSRYDSNNMPDIIIKGKHETLIYNRRRNDPRNIDVEVRLTQDEWQKATPRGLVPASREDVMMALDDVESILLRASMNGAGVNITNFAMESAQSINVGLGAANLVEECSCPPGYEGLSCQKCSSGYTRESSGAWLGNCVPEEPRQCPAGMYGNPASGAGCRPCPCPLTSPANQFARTCALGPRGNVICDCAPGYEGEQCQYCSQGYVGNPLIPGDSCQRQVTSNCDPIGTALSRLPDKCECKQNVQGQYCNQCKQGSFHLSEDNRHGCASCFCSGVTEQCTSSNLRRRTTSVTYNSPQIVNEVSVYQSAPLGDGSAVRYDAPVEASARPQLVRDEMVLDNIDRSRNHIYYWSLPPSFALDKVTAYGGYLRYVLRNVPISGGSNNAPDIQLISHNRLTFHYFGNFNPSSDGVIEASVQFLEKGWRRADGKGTTRQHFLLALADVKAILVKATYSTNYQIASLVSSSIDTAEEGGNGPIAAHVEQCVCPPGYLGTSCEDCAPGYTRSVRELYLRRCQPCECNGHSNTCDAESGECIDCQDNTVGPSCEECRAGYSRDVYSKNCVPDTDEWTTDPPDDNCNCDIRGTVNDEPRCDDRGKCNCKQLVDGKSCDRCIQGSFGLSQHNPDGCIECYCSGVTNECYEVTNFYWDQVPAPMVGEINYNNYTIMDLNARKVINDHFVPIPEESELMYTFSFPPDEELFWSLPLLTLPGNMLLSYGGNLTFKQKFEVHNPYPVYNNPGTDVILVGDEASVYWTNPQYFRSGEVLFNQVPLIERNWFVLNSRVPADRNTFMSVLKNLRQVLVRATLADLDREKLLTTSIAAVAMDKAGEERRPNAANGIEVCRCPAGYAGRSCESCAAGYYQQRGRCLQCNCNGHNCHVGSYDQVVCDCPDRDSGPDCSVIGVVMELHPTIDKSNQGLNPLYRRVSVTCKYRAPEPLTIQFYYKGDKIYAPKHFNTSKLYSDGWHGENHMKLIWNTRHRGEILECHTITSRGFTLGVLTSSLPTPDGDNMVTTSRPPSPQSSVTVTISSPTIMIQNVGGYVNFTCEARSLYRQGSLPISWSKKNGYLPQGRFVIDDNTGKLTIRQLQVSDSGTYICQSNDGVNIGKASATLTVGTNPMTRPTVMIQAPVQEYYEGDRIKLECITSGNPTPTIHWRRGNNQPLPMAVQNFESYLIIENAREMDSGDYRCVASNNVGTADSIASITVRPQPSKPSRDRLTISPTSPEVVEGQTINVVCTGTAYIPSGSIKWVRQDGAELANNVQSQNGVLYINVARLENRGVYTCQTSAGEADAMPVLVTVIPLGTPSPAESPSVEVNINELSIPTGETRTVDCIPRGYPLPRIRWAKHEGELGPGTSQRENMLVISNAQDDDRGYYVCTGTIDGTPIAPSYVKVDIETRIRPRVQIWPQRDNLARIGEQFELRCQVLEGVPPPVILWSRSRGRALSPDVQGGPAEVIKFSKIDVNDEGEYVCYASNNAGNDTATATLKVWSPPEIIITPDRLVSVNFGEPVDVKCRASGYPEPMVSIKLRERSGSRVIVPPTPSAALLRIQSASESDEGDYLCTATYLDKAVDDQFTIQVERGDIGLGTDEGSGEFENLDIPDQQPRPNDLFVLGGTNSKLSCGYSGEYDHELRWSRVDQRPLQKNAQQIGNELLIRSVTKDDIGMYECNVVDRRTGYQVHRGYFNLVVLAPPRVTLRPESQTVSPGQSPSVECIVEGDDIFDISWEPIDKPLSGRVEKRGSTLIFHRIEVEDAGSYKCTAGNRIANASGIAQVIVNEPSRVASESHDNEQVAHVGQAVRFRCDAELPTHTQARRFRVDWIKDGKPLPRSVRVLNDGSLYIKLAKKTDSGYYVCNIRDDQGRSTSNYINLRIEGIECLETQFRCTDGTGCIHDSLLCDGHNDCEDYSDEDRCILEPDNTLSDYPTYAGPREEEPALVAISQPNRQYQVGQNVEVVCRASSRDVRVTWERYGTRQHVDQQPFGEGSSLVLNSVAESDAGVYRCTGTDPYQRKSYDDFTLQIQPASVAPYPENLEDKTMKARLGEPVYIICPRLDQPASVEWRREYSSLAPTVRANEPNLYISRVTEADAGTYICRVNDGRSTTERRVVLQVTGVVPQFNGYSWLAMPALSDAYTQFDIEISFKPTDSEGLILFNNGRSGHYIALRLHNSQPEMVLDDGSGTITVMGDRPLQLNTWHTVRLSRMNTKVTMNVDDAGPFTNEIPTQLAVMELNQPLHIGGVPDLNKLPAALAGTPGFTGCVGMLVLGKQEKDIMADSYRKNRVTECDSCTPNLCLHGGVCQEVRNERGYVCLCPAGYAGQNCDHAGEGCRQHICGPGKCTEVGDTYKCSCPITHTGHNCEREQSIEYPAFTGSAYLAIPPPQSMRGLYVLLKIKAMSPVTDGIIMYCAESEQGHGGFTSLAVRNQRLEFRYQTGDAPQPVILTSRRELRPNEWTEVETMRTGIMVLLRINQNSDTVSAVLPYATQAGDLHLKTAMYVGGVDDSNIILNRNVGVTGGFSGCIKDVLVQNNTVNIVNASIIAANVQECSSYDRGDIPEDQDLCSRCRNNGFCSSVEATSCTCQPGFSGTYCQYRLYQSQSQSPCAANPCKRGTCRPDTSRQSRLNYTCDCPLGYSGANCHISLELHQSVSFDGNGYIELAAENLRYDEDPVEFGVGITTTSAEGVLLYQRESNGRDYVLLRVENARAVLEMDLGEGPFTLVEEGIDVSNGERHVIIIRMYKNKLVQLSVEDRTKTHTYEGLSSLMNADSNIYIGGIPEPLNVWHYAGMTGCFDSIQLTKVPRHSVDLNVAAVAARNAQRCKDPRRP